MKGCLLIHGFTGSPYEVKPLAQYLEWHTNWNIYTPTLAGHGQNDLLHQTTYRDWIASAEQALQQASEECNELCLIGFSMGGLIASHLSSRYDISRLILLSPAVFYPNTSLFFRDMAETVQLFLQGKTREGGHFQQYKNKWKNTSLLSVWNFRRLVKELKPSLQQVHVPVLIIQGQKDTIINPKSAEYTYNMVQSAEKELVWLENSKHILCHDCDKDMVFQKVKQFLQPVSPTH